MRHRAVLPRVPLLTGCSGPGHPRMRQLWSPHARGGGICKLLGCRNASNPARDGYGTVNADMKAAPKFRVQVCGIAGAVLVVCSRGL